jgi:hypothetical protein
LKPSPHNSQKSHLFTPLQNFIQDSPHTLSNKKYLTPSNAGNQKSNTTLENGDMLFTEKSEPEEKLLKFEEIKESARQPLKFEREIFNHQEGEKT